MRRFTPLCCASAVLHLGTGLRGRHHDRMGERKGAAGARAQARQRPDQIRDLSAK